MKKYINRLKEAQLEIAINGRYNFLQNLENVYKLEYFYSRIESSEILNLKKQNKLLKQIRHKIKFLFRRLLNPLKETYKKWIEETESLNTVLFGEQKQQIKDMYRELVDVTTSSDLNKILSTINKAIVIIYTSKPVTDYLTSITNLTPQKVNEISEISVEKTSLWDHELKTFGL